MNAEQRRRYGVKDRPARSVGGGFEHQESNGTCRHCGRVVFWVRGRNGKSIPLEPEVQRHDEPCYRADGLRIQFGLGRLCHWNFCDRQRSKPSGDAGERDARATVLGAIVNTWTLEEVRDMRTQLSRIIGIMDKAGVDSESPRRVRTMLGDAVQRGWGA